MSRNVFPALAIHRVATLPDADQGPGALLRTDVGLFFSDGAQWQTMGFVPITQDDYDALDPPVEGRLYVVVSADP